MSRVAIIGADMADQLFGKRSILNEPITLNGVPYSRRQDPQKNQDSNYSGPDNNKIFVLFAAMSRDMPRPNGEPGTLSDIIVAPKDWVVDLLPQALDEQPPHRRHRLAVRAERPASSRGGTGSTPRTSRRSRCGHVAADADARPDDRPLRSSSSPSSAS